MSIRRISLPLSGKVIPVLIALSLSLHLVVFVHAGHTSVPYRHVIVDTDMGLDDVRAVFALLADTTVAIDAFLTVSGSAALGKGTDNLVGLLEECRSSSVPVIRGRERAELGPPPWRHTANTLGGAAFPPPRKTGVTDFTPEGLARTIDQNPRVQYLALGPLTNLWALETGSPAGFRSIDTIWIPAFVRNGRISDWNILYDAQASEVVLRTASKVVIVDISGATEVDGLDFLSSLDGESFPVLWMERLLSGLGDETGHVMLYDDLAAAAFLRQDLLEFDEQAYAAQKMESGGFNLAPTPGGSVQVARLAGLDGALATLKDLYARGPVARHPDGHAEEVAAEALLRTFHGHLGPYVVIGYRMGRLALSELDSEGHFGISAEVHSPRQTPKSCLIDGVQLGSGCTLGKGNIVVEEGPEPAWATFRTVGGEQATILLRPDIPALVRDLVDAKGVEAAGLLFFQMRLDSLFTVDRRDH